MGRSDREGIIRSSGEAWPIPSRRNPNLLCGDAGEDGIMQVLLADPLGSELCLLQGATVGNSEQHVKGNLVS